MTSYDERNAVLFLAMSTNVSDVTPYVNDEFARLDELRAAGVVVSGWLRTDFSGAVLLVDGSDLGTVNTTLNTLPTAMNGATTFELIPLVDLESARPGT